MHSFSQLKQEFTRTFSYKISFIKVNQLKIDSSKPPTGTSPSEEKPAAKGKEDDDGLYDPSLFVFINFDWNLTRRYHYKSLV